MRWEPEVAVLVGVLVGLAFALVLLRIIGVPRPRARAPAFAGR
jgi:hypothetical protein